MNNCDNIQDSSRVSSNSALSLVKLSVILLLLVLVCVSVCPVEEYIWTDTSDSVSGVLWGEKTNGNCELPTAPELCSDEGTEALFRRLFGIRFLIIKQVRK